MWLAALITAAILDTGEVPGADFVPGTATPDSDVPAYFIIMDGDTIFASYLPLDSLVHRGPLTDADYAEIAGELGVEPAVIHAVVEVETGKTRLAFHSEGKPLINYDSGLFRRLAAKRGVDLAKARREHPEAFQPLNRARYGTQQAAQQARLDAAMAIDSIAAIEATFWGMFQIAGFNYALAGAGDHMDFVRRMSQSEYDQLVCFANFIRNSGMLRHLKTRNWAAFARMYNGPGYANRGYHTKMAAAYRRNKGR